ncbi:hypothetical protein BH09GEM1_BH09GEM1_40510 [soil metagenome]
MSATRAFDIGIALDGTTMAIAWNEGAASPRFATAPCDGTPASITTTLAALVRQVPPATRVAITLCRPLAHSRAVNLPVNTRAAASGILARDWSRHVIGIRTTPHDVVAREMSRGRWLAAFAPADVLDALATAAEKQGWTTVDIRTSDDTLASAGEMSAEYVVVCGERGPVEAVHLRKGGAVGGRRFANGARVDDVYSFIREGDSASGIAQSGRRVIILGATAMATSLAQALNAHGHRAEVSRIGTSTGDAVAVLATVGMRACATLPLAATATRARAARATRRLTWQLGLATAAALVGALLMARWDVARNLTDVAIKRADISGHVQRAVAMRGSVEDAADIAAALADRERRASRASGAAAAIAIALPRSAALTLLTIAGDSLLIEGESPRSAEVYDALKHVPTIDRVQSAAPVRQERQTASAAVERFSFSARLRDVATSAVKTP